MIELGIDADTKSTTKSPKNQSGWGSTGKRKMAKNFADSRK